MIRFIWVFLCVWIAPVALAQVTGPAQIATDAVKQIDAAATMLNIAESSRDRVSALTQTVRAYENGLIALREGLRKAIIRQKTIEQELNAKSAEIAQLLGVLQTIEMNPAPILMLHPSGPTGTARSQMILADVTPLIQAEANALSARLREVNDLRVLQARAVETLQKGLDGAQQARAALSDAIASRTDLPKRFIEDRVQTTLLVASAETLDAFASGLDLTIKDETDLAAPDAFTVKGDLALPVQGYILRRYNETDLAGVSRPGLVVATRPGVLISTPVAATIRFKGRLLDLGHVIITEPAPDVLFIYAGLAETFGEIGEVVAPGAPIGIMGGEAPQVNEMLAQIAQGSGVEATQTLYLEVREGQDTINPAQWFAIE